MLSLPNTFHFAFQPLYYLRLATICCFALLTSELSQAKHVISSTDHQTALNLTLAQENGNKETFSLVQDNRALVKLAPLDTVELEGVSSQLQTNSFNISNIGGFQSLQIPNYQDENQHFEAPLAAYVGKKITLIVTNSGHEDTKSIATLLNINNESAVIKTKNIIKSISLTDPNLRIVLPILEPTSTITPKNITLQSTGNNAPSLAQLTYLTTGLTWDTEYTLELKPEKRNAMLHGLVTINNETKTTFTNSKITLLTQPGNNPNIKSDSNSAAILENVKQLQLKKEALTLPQKLTLKAKTTTKADLFKKTAVASTAHYQYQTTIASSNSVKIKKSNSTINNKKNLSPNFNITFSSNNNLLLPKKTHFAVYHNDKSNAANLMATGIFSKSLNKNKTTYTLYNSPNIQLQQKQISHQKTFDGEIIGMQFQIKNNLAFTQAMELVLHFDKPAQIISSTFPVNNSFSTLAHWKFPILGKNITIFNVRIKLLTQ